MPTIALPWPPADPTQPLDFPHDGCCGPLDTCGRYRRLQLRYDVIGTRVGGPVGAGWLQMATGQVMVADPTLWDWTTGSSMGRLAGVGGRDFLNIHPAHDLPSSMLSLAFFGIDLLGLVEVNAIGLMGAGYCNGQFTIPATASAGPPDPPDAILVTPLRHYETSSYPWLG